MIVQVSEKQVGFVKSLVQKRIEFLTSQIKDSESALRTLEEERDALADLRRELAEVDPADVQLLIEEEEDGK